MVVSPAIKKKDVSIFIHFNNYKKLGIFKTTNYFQY